MTATRFRRELGEGPVPEPFGRPAPGRAPPQVPFFLPLALAFFTDPLPARLLLALDFRVAMIFPRVLVAT
jgi:hypothetical protein